MEEEEGRLDRERGESLFGGGSLSRGREVFKLLGGERVLGSFWFWFDYKLLDVKIE